MSNQMNFSIASIPIASVLNSINTVAFGGLDLQPSYQRGYVWKNDFKDKLIYSIIKQYPIGNISVRVLGNTTNDKGAKSEVVDGQQRLTTIRDFVNGSYIIKSEWSKNIINVIKDYYERANVSDSQLEKLLKKLNNKGKVSLKFKDLPDIIKGNINSYNIPMSYIADATDSQIREYFRFLQNQERLRAGEIINSMPATNLEIYLNALHDKNKLLDVIGFYDDRNEFDKIFYSIIGLFDGKISFGTTDKIIQNYAGNASIPTKGLSNVQNMIEQLNFISHLDNEILVGTRKRYLKFLLLLAGFQFVDFTTKTKEKLLELNKIDNLLATFFSAKADAEKGLKNNYSQQIIDELRYIALLTKGSHPLNRSKNRMEMLAYYINNIDTTVASNIKPIEINN